MTRHRGSGQSHRTGAVVIGGSYRALGAVRSLGRQGIPVLVLSDEHTLATHSRYAQRSIQWPAGDACRRLSLLQNLGTTERLNGWTLFPSDDESAAFLSRHHEALGGQYLLAVPPWENLRWSHDKRLTYQLADDLGIDYPRTSYPDSADALGCGAYEFPVILKPAVKVGLNAFTYAKAWRVETPAELHRRYDEAANLVDAAAIMVQEIIPDADDGQLSYAALCADGEPIATIVARRTRQHPLEFGRSSTSVETIDEPRLEEPARRLLAAMRFSGLVEIEFKRDPRDGCYKLLDINPRVWGWHTLGARAGVDFTFLQWRLIHGDPIPETRARPGVRWIRGSTHLLAVAAMVRARRPILGELLHSLRPPVEFAVLAVDDPLPGLVEWPLLAGVAAKRSIKRVMARETKERRNGRPIDISG